MNSKKHFVLIMMLSALLIGFNNVLLGQELRDPNSEINSLQEKIKQLEIVIESQRKLINELKTKLDGLIKENEKLKTMNEEGIVINDTSKKTSFDPNNVVCRGEKRSRLWFDTMYEKFNDKIVFLDGKYFYLDMSKISKTIIDEFGAVRSTEITKEASYEFGTVRSTPSKCEILQILGHDEILVIRPSSQRFYYSRRTLKGQGIPGSEKMEEIPEIVFCVKGMDTSKLAVGDPFKSSKLVYIDICKHEGVSIRCFQIAAPLTREQFAEAINSDMDLGEYELVLKDYETLRTLSEDQYSFIENKDDGSVIIKKGDRNVKKLRKGEYRFEIVPK